MCSEGMCCVGEGACGERWACAVQGGRAAAEPRKSRGGGRKSELKREEGGREGIREHVVMRKGRLRFPEIGIFVLGH